MFNYIFICFYMNYICVYIFNSVIDFISVDFLVNVLRVCYDCSIL